MTIWKMLLRPWPLNLWHSQCLQCRDHFHRNTSINSRDVEVKNGFNSQTDATTGLLNAFGAYRQFEAWPVGHTTGQRVGLRECGNEFPISSSSNFGATIGILNFLFLFPYYTMSVPIHEGTSLHHTETGAQPRLKSWGGTKVWVPSPGRLRPAPCQRLSWVLGAGGGWTLPLWGFGGITPGKSSKLRR